MQEDSKLDESQAQSPVEGDYKTEPKMITQKSQPHSDTCSKCKGLIIMRTSQLSSKSKYCRCGIKHTSEILSKKSA